MSQRFEDLIIWQQAEKLTLLVYEYTKETKDYWFNDQIRRAAVSIMNNIAEWYEKPTPKDKIKFLMISEWSSAEVRSMCHLGNKLWYFDEIQYKEMQNISIWLSASISKFSKAIKDR